MAKIINISNNSPLFGKIAVNDEIIKFDERDFIDVLDYIYADSQLSGSLTIKTENGEKIVDYEKFQESDSLGLEFDSSVDINAIECCNNCIFCFVKQLPEGLRDTLYIKDDDYRLSFISGSYITCSNLKEQDIQRIIDYKLSPLYVSVHATDETVRKFLLGVKKIPNIMDIMKRLIDANIKLHTQIVLVGGINDKEILQKSLSELYDIGVSSVAVVPVGLTTFRENLHNISPLNQVQAQETIKLVESFYDTHKYFCYCSDEMYQIAKMEVKGEEYYGNYDQIENGVGLIAKFLSEIQEAMNTKPKKIKRSVGVFTGVSGESILIKAKEIINKNYPKLNINIYPVKNKFFGETVTVTGLVTASDIISSYGNKKFTEKYLLIPSIMLKEFETVFLDNTSVKDLSKALKKKIRVISPNGIGFVNGLTGRK